MLKRDLVMTSAGRILTGPEVAGCRITIRPRLAIMLVICFRPVLVTFEEFKDREEVLRKAALLRGSHVQVTEDMSR